MNDLGFVETPYRVVKNGKVTGEIAWLDANREEDAIIAQANARSNDDGTFVDELVLCRQQGDVPLAPPDRIDYMDVAPEQLVSIAAALIPFLEHDDANRALMGSNMQRQAVPLLNPRTPLVGTGLEEKVARDSGAVVIAQARRRRHARHGRRDHRRRRPGASATQRGGRAIVRWRASRSTTATASRSTGAPTRTRRSTSVRSCGSARR